MILHAVLQVDCQNNTLKNNLSFYIVFLLFTDFPLIMETNILKKITTVDVESTCQV